MWVATARSESRESGGRLPQSLTFCFSDQAMPIKVSYFGMVRSSRRFAGKGWSLLVRIQRDIFRRYRSFVL